MKPEPNSEKSSSADTVQPHAGWRIRLGFALFICSTAWPLMMPILPLLGISARTTATFAGIMLVVAEMLMLAAVAITGKDGFSYIKKQLSGLLKSHAPPRVVSALRYRVGLVFFIIPLIYAFVSPYVEKHLIILITYKITFAVTGDIMLLVALFMLGGNFWEKLRSLFMHNAIAIMVDEPAEN